MDHNNVSKPKHYQFSKPCNEVRDVIKDRITELYKKNCYGTDYITSDIVYDYSNAIKYLLRWFEKNGAEDLRKSKYCIDQVLCVLEDGKGSADQSIKCEPSNDVPVVDLDQLWKQEHNKVHPEIKEQFERIYSRLPEARFPPWS